MQPPQSYTAYHTFQEIVTQPDAWQGILEEMHSQAGSLHDLVKRAGREHVIFTGCGSPYYLAQTAAAIYGGVTGAPARAHPASDLLLFPDLTLACGSGQLLIALSRSGKTTETVRAVEAFQAEERGASIAITCYPGTPLARHASRTVVAYGAHEQSLAQTRSFTSMLVGAQALIFALANKPLPPAMLRLPELGAALIEEYRALAMRLAEERDYERMFFLGSGPFFGLASEATLKMKEMSLTAAEAYHFLEFRHGPMAMVNRQTLLVGLLSERALPHEIAVLDEMRALGARVLAITPVALPATQVDYQVVLPSGLTDLERGALYLPVLQLLAFHRAVCKGLDPDQPTNLKAFISLALDGV